ncbi:ATP-binding protein [Virgisporangium aliadipatigenens]|uniref:ATP-binding protein n=1 Tax=Virgisporangium aliadipatigenens TaxID=741659 RepID=UPI004032A612
MAGSGESTWDEPESGYEDEPTDYDGGLQAVADGGRVAIFHGPGAQPQGMSAPAEVDSPFLGLFTRGEPGAPPARRSNGHPRQAPAARTEMPTIDPLQLPPLHDEPAGTVATPPLPVPERASAGNGSQAPRTNGNAAAPPVAGQRREDVAAAAVENSTVDAVREPAVVESPRAPAAPEVSEPSQQAPSVDSERRNGDRVAGDLDIAGSVPADHSASQGGGAVETVPPSEAEPAVNAVSGAARPGATVAPPERDPDSGPLLAGTSGTRSSQPDVDDDGVAQGAAGSGSRTERAGRRGKAAAAAERRTVRRRTVAPAQPEQQAADQPVSAQGARRAFGGVEDWQPQAPDVSAGSGPVRSERPAAEWPPEVAPPAEPFAAEGYGAAAYPGAEVQAPYPTAESQAGYPADAQAGYAAPVQQYGPVPGSVPPSAVAPAAPVGPPSAPMGGYPARPPVDAPYDQAAHQYPVAEPAYPAHSRPASQPAGYPRYGTEVAPREPGQVVPSSRRSPAKTPKERDRKPPKRARLDKTPKPKNRDRDPSVELAITEIAGHLTFTPNAVTAWYTLPEVRWAFRPDADREALLMAISEQYAGLAGFRLHLRRTTRPFPADQWARMVDRSTPYPLPTVEGAPSWGDHLVAAQQHLIALNHAEGQTFLGIQFARRTLGDTFAERIGRLFNKGVGDAERRRMSRTVEQFDEVLGAFGMRGRRVTARELEFLLYRSVALGMSPPSDTTDVEHGGWERGDLLALTEQIERYRTPYGSTVKLVNRLTDEERHVAILAVGRMEPLEIPERHEPWLHFHERLPWAMEISSRVDILGPGDSFRNLEHRLRLIRSQQQDYAEHGIDAPPELERLAKRALTIGDDMTTGLPVDSSRAHGWHRIAVSGRTREECLERARRLTQLYSREMRVSLQHPKNQDWLAREFIPGEPLANTGYLRRMPVKLFAAALPQAASTVGDRRGDLIGRTAGTSRRPVFLDLHFPMEVRERSGLAVFVAEPGGGKSTLMGALGYLAARRGVQVTLLDPSGPLARLCQMPEVRPYAHVLNLTGSEQGTLAPYALIPTPQRAHFAQGVEGDREFDIALSNARAERRMLVQDICMMLVPPQVAREASTATLLRHAARQIPAEETSTLDDVVKILREMGDPDASELGNLLLDAAEMPLAMLFFGKPPTGSLGSDAALTVITMAGLRLPDLKIEREYWSAEEALALPMLHTAHRLAVRRCYGGDMYRRKLVGLDEAHFMEGWRSGRSFLVRLARDSRKWNLAALVASQNPRDILGLDVQNLVSTVFVGRIAEDSEIAAEALRLLRVPTDVGYEQTLASLSQVDSSSSTRLGFREFIMRDVDGRVQKTRVDVSYVPDLLTYLDTTPASTIDPVLVGPRDPEET